jgi:NAD(P)-dependent dehydrogenase (short-subunit alcohol dehydrogenase family)
MPDFPLFNLSGRKALVTGGSRGIGRACATALAMAGADVAIAGRDESTAEEAVASLKRFGNDAVFIRCDVSNPEQVENMVKAVVRQFGRLDIAINNAGIYKAGADETQSKEDWDQVIAVNLTGTWLCAKAEMHQMILQRPMEGKIINIGSLGAVLTVSNGSYDASKAAVVQMTKALAARWGRYNINVNCVTPGYVEAVFGTIRSAEECEILARVTPLGHVQRLEDLYGPVLFLASKASDYVTGQNLVVDGGHALSTWMIPLEERCTPPRSG